MKKKTFPDKFNISSGKEAVAKTNTAGHLWKD